MALSNIPMPSFTLVLTSGHRSHRRHPTTIRFDTLSGASDRLMKTIDLRDEPEDDDHGHYAGDSTASISQEDVDLPVVSPVVFEEAEPSSSGSIAKEASHSIKANLLLFFHKFMFKGKLALVKKISSST